MIYYFVERDGDIVTEDMPRGWFSTWTHQNMFTSKRHAVATAKVRVKHRIKELEERLKELQEGKL